MPQSRVTMKALLEAGVHFGHRTRRWNPKMRSYIFTERNGIHIIDLGQTVTQINKAYEMVRDITANNGVVLFAGTKRQAQETIEREAERSEMPYVNQRWLGGTLTNFMTIRSRVKYLQELENRQRRGELELMTKKEALDIERKIAKLNRRLGGIKNMETLPDALFVVDVRREHLAVKEANILKIPVIAMVDTNCDPEPIDLPIPANDDAIRAIRLVTSTIADAALEGRQMRQAAYLEELEQEVARDGVDTSRRVFSPFDNNTRRSRFDDDEDWDDNYNESHEKIYIGGNIKKSTIVQGNHTLVGSGSSITPSREAFAVARIKDVENNTSLYLATQYKLLTGVSHKRLSGFTVQKFALPSVEEIEIDVIVHAPSFSILPQRRQSLQFVRGSDSKLLEFTLIPQEVGEPKIEVRFYYQRNWLTTIALDVIVVDSAQVEEQLCKSK